MVMPECSDGVKDMFPVNAWDLAGIIKRCQSTYGVTPRPHWIVEQFGGKNIATASNIIFRCVRVCACVWECVFASVCGRLHAYIFRYLRVWVLVDVCVCICGWICVTVCGRVHACMCVYMS